jgi:hypothetical protein
LEFYLCDATKFPSGDIELAGFANACHYLKRVPNTSCESGNDKLCGPIDPKFPGRWILPCRLAAGEQGDQIFGGDSGRMAYQIPDVVISDAIVHTYWGMVAF